MVLMFKNFYKMIWAEAYANNDKNIISLLETDKTAHVLDVGCGDGKKTITFKRKIGCKTITGIDGVAKRLSAAKKRGVDRVTLVELEKKWPFDDSSFDVVVSNQVIEHVGNTDHFISEIKRVLRPGGYAVVSTENLASWHNILALIFGFQDFSHHIIMKSHVGNPVSPHFNEKTLTWSKKDNSGSDDTAYPHLKIPTYYSLKHAFTAYGFKFVKGYGSGYYPLFGLIGQIASRLNPTHSHFITAKFKK